MADSFAYDVFLSHNQADKPQVRRLAERLRVAGLRVWFDEWIIRPGDDIYLAIEDGLEMSRTLVLCLSPTALGSDWVRLERSTALFRDPANASRRFIPLLLTDCNLPQTLRRYKYVDYRRESQAVFDQLLAECRSQKQVKEMPFLESTRLVATGRKCRIRRWAILAMVLVLLALVGTIVTVTALRATWPQGKSAPFKPPATSADVDRMAARVLTIASDCVRDPSLVMDRRLELRQLAVKVSSDPRYLEDAPGPTAALYRLVAAALLLQPTETPDRERLKEGLYWLGKLRDLTPSLQSNSELKETEDFFSAFLQGKTSLWDANEATKRAVKLATLGSKEVDVVKLSRKIMDGAKNRKEIKDNIKKE